MVSSDGQPKPGTRPVRRMPRPAPMRQGPRARMTAQDAQGFVWLDHEETHHAVDHARIARAWATYAEDEEEVPTMDDVVIRFDCENCQQTVSAPMADDWTVECPACTHTVHAGVYVADSELRALWRLDPESE